ncbi:MULTISPECIES: ferritin-like domain-containing protein [Nocardiopsidaceae]|uniref:Ferritin-like domain-containing protein n=2 Tax=Nocardiopsidaceae TaxID=83676 RepID=A0ABY6YQJ6_9ACTN|nr:ferritin-like domain-containing protein [Streptomonospora nanhaiensis]WAE74667.1 ferritin-like domain-containing protein [Streptomonospora nanhaiensis]
MSESPVSTPGGADPGADPGPDALAEALSAEHAAVYGYEFVGGAAGDRDRRERALEAAQQHKALRDALRAAAVERGFGAPSALATYPLPEGRDDDGFDAFAVGLEETAARAYLWLTASGDAGLRSRAARALQETTLRGLEWGGELDALPGFETA